MSNELILLKHAFYHLIFMYYIIIYSVFLKKTQAVPNIHYTYLLFTNVSRYGSLMLPQGLMSKGVAMFIITVSTCLFAMNSTQAK